LLLWFIPLLTTSVVVGWFNELSEHYPLIGLHKNELYMTRNRFSHWIEHFLFNTHNENYHLVHHIRARIPYWNLKKAHAVLCQDPNYAKVNQGIGGIFASSNGAPSLLNRFLMEPVINRQGQVQYE
jgi:fatty acid desaturase